MKNIKSIFINDDSLNYFKKIPKNSIDCFILDPPYFKVVSEFWDNQFNDISKYLEWIELFIKEFKRISKKNSVIWIFGFNYQLGKILNILEKYNFRYKQTIALNKGLKSIAGRSSSKLKMFPTASEYIYFFYNDCRKDIKNFLREKAEIKKLKSSEINKYLGKAYNGGGTWSSIAGKNQSNLQFPTREDWKKLQNLLNFNEKYENFVYTFNLTPGLTDIWNDIDFYIKNRIHPTQKPTKLIERIVLTSTNKGQWILDPFAGSGITCKISKKFERNCICIEKEKKYYDLGLKNE